MAPHPATLIAGNWKMHTTPASARSLAKEVLRQLPQTLAAEVLLLPPFTALEAVHTAVRDDGRVRVGAQDCHWEREGAFTGEISVAMLAPMCDYILVGHSERRHLMGETDAVVRRKLDAVLREDLMPILAVGETREERDAGTTEAVLERQLRSALTGLRPGQVGRCTIAYEPVWAIGTGATATPDDASAAAGFIANLVRGLAGAEVRVLYGGSVTAAHAAELLQAPSVSGALVGGASLRAAEFAAIVAAA